VFKLCLNVFSFADLQKLLHGSHYIGGKVITVSKQPLKRKTPSDPLRVHVRGLNGNTTEDCLLFYLEKFSLDADVKEITFGDNKSAIATFNTKPGNIAPLSYLKDKLNSRSSRDFSRSTPPSYHGDFC